MAEETSISKPLELDPIATGPSGQNTLYLCSAPGKVSLAPRLKRFRWNRDLDMDLTRMKEVYHIDEIVSLLEPEEAAEVGLSDYPQRVLDYGIAYQGHPIPDQHAPPESFEEFDEFIQGIVDSLEEGRNIAVHCSWGIGRGATIVAAVLIKSGSNADDAIKWVQQQRKRGSLRRRDQQEYLRGYADYLQS